MCCSKDLEDDASVCSSGSGPTEDGERPEGNPKGRATKEGESPGEQDRAAIEKRIVARIVDICSPAKTGRTSRLMQTIQVRTLPGASQGPCGMSEPFASCLTFVGSLVHAFKTSLCLA